MARNRSTSQHRDPVRRSSAEQHAAEIDAMLLATGAGTAEHSLDVERLALRIADQLGLSGDLRKSVGIAARLHDIGKAAIPGSLLEKPAALSGDEWALMRDHTVLGERLLMGGNLDDVPRYVRHSHERWDGGGYPDGLRGEEIPLASRIIFCADAYDAICTNRPYRRAVSPAEGLAEIRRSSGTQFDPRVVEALARAVRPQLYRRSSGVERRPHARLLAAMAVFSIGAIGTATAAVTNDRGPTIVSPTTAQPAPLIAQAPSSGGLTPPFSSGRTGGGRKNAEHAKRAGNGIHGGDGRVPSGMVGAGQGPAGAGQGPAGPGQGPAGPGQGSAPQSSPATGSAPGAPADAGGPPEQGTHPLPIQVPGLNLLNPQSLLQGLPLVSGTDKH
jgi:hypothetical protein